MYEYSCFCAKKKVYPNLYLMSLGGIALITLFFLSTKFTHVEPLFIGLFFLLIALSTITKYEKISSAITNVATELFAILYIGLPFAILVKMLYTSFYGLDGRLWVGYLILVTKITDIGAYFGGRLFGHAKLCKILSPKKTWEGAVFGLASATFFSWFFFYILPFFGLQISFSIQAVILGAAISVFGQLGDLSESLFKRDADVKDSNTLPGLGGVLDLFDSLFFTAPLLYYFLLYF